MKYKICPHCGKHCPPAAFDCEACNTDLMTVRVTDEETEKAAAAAAPVPKTVRVCENCGLHNPSNARKCAGCGEDISDIMPVEETAAEAPHFTLASLDGRYAFALSPGKTLIGKEHEMGEYLADKPFVSRKQAELTLGENKLMLLNLSRSNGTYVNNVKCGGDAVELHDGDELGLGGNSRNGQRQEGAAYFMVRIGTCS